MARASLNILSKVMQFNIYPGYILSDKSKCNTRVKTRLPIWKENTKSPILHFTSNSVPLLQYFTNTLLIGMIWLISYLYWWKHSGSVAISTADEIWLKAVNS